MDIETLALAGALKVDWVGDRINSLSDIKPRHIGQPVTMEVVDTVVGNDTFSVIGTLEGREGSNLVVNATTYNRDRLQNIRIWRKIIRKDS